MVLQRAGVRFRGREEALQGRDIKDVLKAGEVSVPVEGMDEPRFRREGGTRDMVLPENKKFVEGDYLPRPNQGGGRHRARRRRQRGHIPLRFEPRRIRRPVPRRSGIARSRQAQARPCRDHRGTQRAGYATSGSPANISISRTVSRVLARRVALRRPRRDTIADLEEELADCDDEAHRAKLLEQIEALKAVKPSGSCSSIPSISVTAGLRPCRSLSPRPSCSV